MTSCAACILTCRQILSTFGKLCAQAHKIQAWETTSWCSLAGGRAYMATVHGKGQKYLASVASALFLLLAYVLGGLLI